MGTEGAGSDRGVGLSTFGSKGTVSPARTALTRVQFPLCGTGGANNSKQPDPASRTRGGSVPEEEGAMKWTAKLIGTLLATGCAGSTTERLRLPQLETVAHVDLPRYLGTWYEIANFPQSFQRGCTATTATYTLREGRRHRCAEPLSQGFARREGESGARASPRGRPGNERQARGQLLPPVRVHREVRREPGEAGDRREDHAVGALEQSPQAQGHGRPSSYCRRRARWGLV